MPDRPGRRHEVYIGDSVYGYIDALGCVVLYLWNGYEEKNRIVMEPEVLRTFEEWIEAIRRKGATR